MILPCLDNQSTFPGTDHALTDPDGLLCYGGDLNINRLLAAYRLGIFPWYSAGEPIMWWCPSERMVLFPQQLHVSKSLKKSIQKLNPQFYFNRNFKTVIHYCARIQRKDRGTWIHPEMITAYTELFNSGHGFCLEVEIDGILAGGIYGVMVNDILCGESMFSTLTNGSKFAMYGLCQHMLKNNIKLLDCQIHNPHLESMGARLIPRQEFKSMLSN